MEDEFFTVAEVAELLKLNQMTIRNWINSGRLPAVRLGQRRVRIRRTDLDRLIEEGYTGKRREVEPGLPDQEKRAAPVWPPMQPETPGDRRSAVRFVRSNRQLALVEAARRGPLRASRQDDGAQIA